MCKSAPMHFDPPLLSFHFKSLRCFEVYRGTAVYNCLESKRQYFQTTLVEIALITITLTDYTKAKLYTELRKDIILIHLTNIGQIVEMLTGRTNPAMEEESQGEPVWGYCGHNCSHIRTHVSYTFQCLDGETMSPNWPLI